MPVIDEILSWSNGLSELWLRDALRRIVTLPELTDSDSLELAELCKKAHGLSGTTVVPVPLSAGHVPNANDDGPVCVAAVTHVSDVNALVPNGTIAFGKTGLTVVYGDNGAGKSGYSRILRRACRARGATEPILANALSDKPGGTPTAKITTSVAGVEAEHVWKDGVAGPALLGAVSVFDAAAAHVYVADKTEVRFRPLGLDILDRLASVCVRVKAILEGEKKALEARSVLWPQMPADTEAGRLLSSLTALTAREQVERLATLSDAEKTDLATLKDVLATARLEDPTKKANELKTKATRIRRIVPELKKLAEVLGIDSLAKLGTLTQEVTEARKVAEVAARAFDGGSFPGIGTSAWRAMWDAARTYSETLAYPSHAFPHVEGAACVLCRQALGTDAGDRLRQFEEFYQGQAQAAYQAKTAELENARGACLAVVPGDKTGDALEDLVAVDPVVGATVSEFLKQARECQSKVTGGTSAAPVAVAVVAPTDDIEAVAAGLDRRAAELLRAADPTTRKQTQQCHDELYAREILSGVREKVLEEIERKARINAYERCVKDTDTRAMTKVSAELTKKYVTEALTAAFSRELGKLGFTALELELVPVSAQKGVLYHQVQLKHATRAQLPRVVSEGEGRCIALAAFLAEVGCAQHASTIVFDDPVSSLDHVWRSSVARRLVSEAEKRQVIVFTHELVFLWALLQEAEARGVANTTLTLSRGGDALAGYVDASLPWHGLSVQKRIGVIKNEWQRAEKVHRTEGQTAYEPFATIMYAKLRKTWERAVEEILFNQALLRFREGVETKRLKADITQADVDAIETGMTKCSKWEGGHDQALAVNERLPPPDEVKADIAALEDWVASVLSRRAPRKGP